MSIFSIIPGYPTFPSNTFVTEIPAKKAEHGTLILGDKRLTVKNSTQEVTASFEEVYCEQRKSMLDQLTGLSTHSVDLIEEYLNEVSQPQRKPGATATPVNMAQVPASIRVHLIASSFFSFAPN